MADLLKKIFISLLTISLNTSPSFAKDGSLPPELQGLGLSGDILPVGETDAQGHPAIHRATAYKSVIPFIRSSLPKAVSDAALNNITSAEQVFCYHVTAKPKDYTGYILDNFALADYCGELNIGETATVYEALFTKSPNIITAPANCTIKPRVVLRFVRGVDYTDVLLSSPCPSFTVFYAGRYAAFNVKQGIIDDIISQFAKNSEEFNSPALLKKTVANGEASSDKEAEAYEKKQRENAPVMNWLKKDQSVTPDSDTSSAEKAATETGTSESPSGKDEKKGWGNIKINW